MEFREREIILDALHKPSETPFTIDLLLLGVVVRISDEESHLLIACSLSDEEGTEWRLSLILGEMHLGKMVFHSCEAAQTEAERILSDYLQRYHLLGLATSETIFDDPFHEVVAQLAT